MTKAKGLSFQRTPQCKGNPHKPSPGSLHGSLTHDSTAAPYPRWLWAPAVKWTADYGLFGALTPPILQISPAPPHWRWCRYQWQQQLPVHKTCNSIFKNHLHLFFQLCCFGKAASSPDNKAVCHSGGAEGSGASSNSMPDQKISFLSCKHYIFHMV